MHLGSPAEGDAFLTSRWPEARAVSNPDRDLYRAFGLGRGSAAQLFGPAVFWAGLKSALRGHGIGKPVGDPLTMSGWFLVHEGRIVWSHVHEHAGAPRRWEELARAWAALRAGPSPRARAT